MLSFKIPLNLLSASVLLPSAQLLTQNEFGGASATPLKIYKGAWLTKSKSYWFTNEPMVYSSVIAEFTPNPRDVSVGFLF
ncbi:hypothetical protein D3C73_21130 [compost metagenome]